MGLIVQVLKIRMDFRGEVSKRVLAILHVLVWNWVGFLENPAPYPTKTSKEFPVLCPIQPTEKIVHWLMPIRKINLPRKYLTYVSGAL